MPARLLPRSAGAGEEVTSTVTEPAVQSKPDGTSGNWFDETREFWEALEIWLPIEEDEAEEAVALQNQTKVVEAMQAEQEAVIAKKSYMRGKADESLGKELDKLQGLVVAYWSMRVARVLSKEVVKKGFVSFLTYGNVIFIAVFLRTVIPRLLVVGSLDDFLGIANEVGVPSRGNMIAALEALQGYDFILKVALFTLAFILEKLTLISEILPVQVGLKTIAPVVFGGLIPGALVSATCETVGAIVNFFVGRTFLTQQLRGVSFFGGKPVGEAKWYGRLESAAEKDGLQLTLLLRLSHILPVPFDSYWYILGALPVRTLDFVAAHWVGCLKTAFLDACLGLLLLTSAGLSLEGGEKQQILVAESLGFAIVAFLVQTFATNLTKSILGLEEEEEADGGKPEQPGSGAGKKERGEPGEVMLAAGDEGAVAAKR